MNKLTDIAFVSDRTAECIRVCGDKICVDALCKTSGLDCVCECKIHTGNKINMSIIKQLTGNDRFFARTLNR